ncbi:MAG: FecR domain-containing protein [Deltaproteobacteria bacterium]|nr:FecR domain-containing protein [Deltaproteobacteria bacterium]
MNNKDFVSKNRRNRIAGIIVTSILLVAAVVLVFGYLMGTEDPRLQKGAIAEVAENIGETQIVRNYKDIVCSPGMIIMSGDLIRTEKDGRVKIRYFDDETAVTLHPESDLIFNAMDSGKHVKLVQGAISLEVPDQAKGIPMGLVTQNSAVTLTEECSLMFSFTGLNSSLSVQKGKALFRRFTDGMTIEVAAGQSHTFKPAGPDKIEFEL